jgi:hypothetical protein
MNRRAFLSTLLGSSLPLVLGRRALAQAAPPRPRIGAIRWDAWYDPADGKVAQAVEKSLGPAEFHYRMPFFGKETGPDSVRINGCTQEIIDREIAAASAAGLAYWAYCAYAPSDPLSNALHLHLSSKRRSDIAFCLIAGMESSMDYFKAQTDYQLSLMREPGYMKVLNGRPLFFIFGAADEQIARSGGLPRMLEWVQHMRSELQKSGHGNPYFVLSEWTPARAVRLCRELQLDAVGLYATFATPVGATPYKMLAEKTESYWNKFAATGLNVVPNIMSGWNTRPRKRNPPPWNAPKAPVDPHSYFQDGTPQEIAQHVADAVQWIKSHPAQALAHIGLIYAWDECDEGFGALLPTYDRKNPQGNDARLKAIGAVLNKT